MATSTDALTNLQNFQAGMKSPDQAFTDANSQFGVPAAQQALTGLRGAIQNTTTLLNNVAPGVMGRTGNSLVTSGQANRIIQNEQAPIQTNLSKLGTDYGNAESDFQNAESQANTKAQGVLTGQQGQLSYLQDLYKTLLGKEQQDAALAEQQRQFNLTPHGSGGGGLSGLGDILGALSGGTTGATSGAPSADLKTIQRDIGRAFQNIQNQPAFYTEKTIIPAIAKEYYGGTSADQLAAAGKVVYDMRKKLGLG